MCSLQVHGCHSKRLAGAAPGGGRGAAGAWVVAGAGPAGAAGASAKLMPRTLTTITPAPQGGTHFRACK